MATRALMAELLQQWTAHRTPPATLESLGGVEALKRVRAGAAFDVVILASDAIAALGDEGRLAASGAVPLAKSSVAMAVRKGAALPSARTEAELRSAVLAAASIGYSTGPSGVALQQLFQRWGIADAVRAKVVQAPPGTPVGNLIADGTVELGFQQYSELMHVAGIQVIRDLPPGTQVTTVFSGAITRGSARRGDAARLLAFLSSAETAATKRQHGMAPV